MEVRDSPELFHVGGAEAQVGCGHLLVALSHWQLLPAARRCRNLHLVCWLRQPSMAHAVGVTRLVTC